MLPARIGCGPFLFDLALDLLQPFGQGFYKAPEICRAGAGKPRKPIEGTFLQVRIVKVFDRMQKKIDQFFNAFHGLQRRAPGKAWNFRAVKGNRRDGAGRLFEFRQKGRQASAF